MRASSLTISVAYQAESHPQGSWFPSASFISPIKTLRPRGSIRTRRACPQCSIPFAQALRPLLIPFPALLPSLPVLSVLPLSDLLTLLCLRGGLLPLPACCPVSQPFSSCQSRPLASSVPGWLQWELTAEMLGQARRQAEEEVRAKWPEALWWRAL